MAEYAETQKRAALVQVIPEEAVVAAAAVIALGEMEKAHYLKVARAAIGAAAPHIRAQALRDAASELDGKTIIHKPFNVYYPEWLRSKASKEVGK